MEIAGTVGSGTEHGIIEQVYGVDAISAVKAIQLANAQGLKTYKVTSANVSNIIPILQISNAVKADVQNAVNTGKEVAIPESELLVNEWRGIGYIVSDPITGAGAYIISGGIAGGANAGPLSPQLVEEQTTNWGNFWKCLLVDKFNLILRILLVFLLLAAIARFAGIVVAIIGAVLLVIILIGIVLECLSNSRGAGLKIKRDGFNRRFHVRV